MSARRLLALGTVVLLSAALTLLAALGQAPLELAGSVHSAGDTGRLALYLLFERLGFEPEVWERPPGELLAEDPRGAGTLWLAAVPEGYSPDVSADDPLERARAAGIEALEHYRAFVEGGGRLILPSGERTESFVKDVLGLPPPRALAGSFLEVDTEQLSEHLARRQRDGAPDPESGLRRIADEGGPWEDVVLGDRAVARSAAIGAGTVLVLEELLDNAVLRSEAGSELSLAAVRLVESEAPDGPLRFGERALHDGFGSGSAAALAFGPGKLLTWHLAALALLVVWAAAHAREFPRDPPEPEPLAPLSRALATADGLVRAGRIGTLSRLLRSGPHEDPRAPRSVAGPAPSDLEGLVELDRSLRALERERDRGRRARGF